MRPRLARIAQGAGLVLLALASSSCSPARAGAWAATRALRLPVVGAPGGAYEDVSWRSDDGLRLSGWLLRPGSTPRGLVVLLHGKDGTRQHVSVGAERLRQRGFMVLAFDQRGHGRSEGSLCTFGVREVADLSRGLDAVLGAKSALPVFLVGESMGAAVALRAAAHEPRVRAVAAAAPFAELTTILEERSFLSKADTSKALAMAERAWGFPAGAVAPATDAASIAVPVLLLYGSEDTYINPAHSYRVYAALSCPKELVALEGVRHDDVLQHGRVWEVIAAWLDRVASVHPC